VMVNEKMTAKLWILTMLYGHYSNAIRGG